MHQSKTKNISNARKRKSLNKASTRFTKRKDLATFSWEEKFSGKSIDQKVEIFHNFLKNRLDNYFPEKITKLSGLEKKWINTNLKQIQRAMKRYYFKHRKSKKYKELKAKFKKVKRENLKPFYSNFVTNLNKIQK